MFRARLTRVHGWRWQIGLDFRAIKAVMQMDVLRCKTPAMIEKEIAAHLLAYNLVRSVMAQAAALTTLLPRQLSFKVRCGNCVLLSAFCVTATVASSS